MPDSGKDLGADLYGLYTAGKDYLPSAAGQYREASRLIAADLTLMFRRSDLLGGPYGPAHGAWTALHREMHRILAETADNLDSVGEALCLAAQQYARTDAAAADEFRRLIQVNGEPQPNGGDE
jgi:hypothetical protein